MSEFPRILWTHKDKDVEIRLVQVSKDRIVPEKRLADDAMDNSCWYPLQWEGWVHKLALAGASVLGVHSLDEAQKWFLENHTGTVTCVQGDRTNICETYIEAESFYKESEDNDRSS